jgi:hypothetical protein
MQRTPFLLSRIVYPTGFCFEWLFSDERLRFG